MNKLSILGGVLFFVLLLLNITFAHPGRTDALGGHYCKTDCELWGLQYGEYHFHDAYDNPIQTYEHNEAIFSRELAERLHGQILLQVEEHGEAYYIRSNDSMKYYMKDGDTAYTMMRQFSLGITDADLATIPSVFSTTEMNETESICESNPLANRLRGEILFCKALHLDKGDFC